MSEKIKIIANPSLLQIGFSLSGILFFSSITFYMYNSEWIIEGIADSIMMWILLVLFATFTLVCLFMLLKSKKVILTNEALTISYPLLFYIKNIDFSDVRKVKEDDYNVKSSHNFSTIEVYNGKKITLELFESKKIVITSFEVTNYKNLAKNLRNITKSYYKLNIEEDSLKNTQGYGWLIFMLILTFGLIVSIIRE
ncbi:hypothetical protein [Flavobacterium sp. RSSB_23]|uniref:hypothetical protein n=1 Tax=Flavobacterium sp. RSSB_23 TaxID=3447668 RepID=UPI003F34C9A9